MNRRSHHLIRHSILVVNGYVKYKDPKQPLNTRIKDLLSRMTLEEKIGQMVQIERSVASAGVMNKYYIGSILSGGGSVPAPKATAQTWIGMVNDFQNGALSTRLGIPMIYGIDPVSLFDLCHFSSSIHRLLTTAVHLLVL